MNRLYNKSEIWFSVLWIVVYIVGTMVLDGVANALGIPNVFQPIFYVLLSLVIIVWIIRNNLLAKYGLCRSPYSMKYFLYFIPLVVLVSINFWCGVGVTTSLIDTVIFVISMLAVGFIEEIIFRGFLFRAMEQDGIILAILISSLTFGFGHIINLFSGAEIVSTLLQIGYATTTGFLFVVILYRGGTLIPCIITHSLFNALSVFSVTASPVIDIIISLVIMILTMSYSLVLLKTLPREESNRIPKKE